MLINFKIGNPKKQVVILISKLTGDVLFCDVIDNFDSPIDVDYERFNNDFPNKYSHPITYHNECKHFASYVEENYPDIYEVIEGEVNLESEEPIKNQIYPLLYCQLNNR